MINPSGDVRNQNRGPCTPGTFPSVVKVNRRCTNPTGTDGLVRFVPSSSLPSGARVISRSEEHTSELQSLLRTSYAVFCLQKKNKRNHSITQQHNAQLT